MAEMGRELIGTRREWMRSEAAAPSASDPHSLPREERPTVGSFLHDMLLSAWG